MLVFVVSLKADCFFYVPLKGRGLFIAFYHVQVQKNELTELPASYHLLWSSDSAVSFPSQVQTAPSQCLPTPPSGAGRSTLGLGWPGLPTRLWWTRASCGSLEVMSSTPPTITWSKRKYSTL